MKLLINLDPVSFTAGYVVCTRFACHDTDFFSFRIPRIRENCDDTIK